LRLSIPLSKKNRKDQKSIYLLSHELVCHVALSRFSSSGHMRLLEIPAHINYVQGTNELALVSAGSRKRGEGGGGVGGSGNNIDF
jgi:uncharacterized membrane protein